MDHAFWNNKWQNPSPGFNQQSVNEYLKTYAQKVFGGLQGKMIFVPLCGRSIDMKWLMEQGCQVVGSELSSKACELFFEQHGLSFKISEHRYFKVFEADQIKIFCGDSFLLTQDDLGVLDGVYDRAALIALPKDMRRNYAQQICALKPASALVVTLEYQGGCGEEPPFSVLAEEVKEHYAKHFDTQELHVADGLASSKRLNEKGVDKVSERVFGLRFKN